MGGFRSERLCLSGNIYSDYRIYISIHLRPQWKCRATIYCNLLREVYFYFIIERFSVIKVVNYSTQGGKIRGNVFFLSLTL